MNYDIFCMCRNYTKQLKELSIVDESVNKGTLSSEVMMVLTLSNE